MSITFTYTLSSTLVAAVSATTISATASVSDISATPAPTTDISASVYVVPLTPLPAQNVFVGDESTLNIQPAYEDGVTASEEVALEYDAVYADSVTITESQVKVYTGNVDYDPSDDDVDPDPVTMADSDSKELSRPDVVDSVVSTETHELTTDKVLSDTLPTPTDAINTIAVGLNKADAVTAAEAIDKFDVTTEFADLVTVTEATEKDITPEGKTDSVEMLGSQIKVFNSSVDFDPSDADVDPDPVAATDQINQFAPSLGKTDAVSVAEANAKDFEFGGFNDSAAATDTPELNPTKSVSDAVTTVEGAKLNPQPVKTDSVTATDTVNKFDPRLNKTDSVTASEAVDKLDIELTKTDSVNITDVNVKNFTENVDYDRSDADADADPVSITELLAATASKPLTESFAPSDAQAYNTQKALADSYTVTESIYTLLTLGESTYIYPDFVTASDGSSGFVQDAFRFTKANLTAQLGGADSLLNTDVVWGGATDDLARATYTGVIGSDGFIGQVVVNSDTITYPDISNAGLVVNFHYTDVDDTTLGGYYLNQTPISAGNSVVGARTIL